MTANPTPSKSDQTPRKSEIHLSTPYLLCVEGSAGSGKTTLCAALSACCMEQGLDAQIVSEFSPTSLGRELSEILARFSHFPNNRPAMQDLIHCVLDKLSSLLALPEPPSNITVLDRGFITQTVLAIPYIEDKSSLGLATSLISLCNEWLHSRYIVTTLILKLPEAENIRRLEQRLGRTLTANEHQVMRSEIERYIRLEDHPDAARIGLRILDAVASPEMLAQAIVSDLQTLEYTP